MNNSSNLLVGIGSGQKGINGQHARSYAVILPHCQRSAYRSLGPDTYGNFTPMDMGEILKRITKRADELGMTEAGLSKEAGLSRDAIRNWRRRWEAGEDSAGANVTSVSKIAAKLGVSELWLLHGVENEAAPRPTIAIAGKVGAGARVPVMDAYEKGDGPQVEAPRGLPANGIVAVEVEGDSMEPVYSSGDLLFYSRETHDGVPDDVIGHRCVCEDVNGMGWVKQVKRGSEPGLYHLISINPGAENMHDVRLKWAARVRLHWPEDLAVKM